MKFDPFLLQDFHHHVSHGVVFRVQDLVSQIHDSNLNTQAPECLRHLDSNGAGTDCDEGREEPFQ
jgi:hypothetical protein